MNSAAAGQDILSAVPSYNGFRLQLDLAEGALTQTVWFELDSDLLPVPAEGGLLLCDRQGNAVGILGDLLSESGVSNDIPWTVTESLSGTYLLSATLPRNGESYTVSTTQVFEDLQDATIYEGDLGTYGISSDISVGYSNSYGTHRALIRPNNWTLLSSSNPNLVIESATLVLYHTYQTDPTMNIEVRPFTGSTWEQSTVVWNDVSGGSYGAPVLDSKSISYSGSSGFYSFNITSRVRMWYNGNSSWQKGLVVRWTDEQYVYDESPCAVFAATEHSEELFRPHLMIQTSTLPTLEDGVYQITSAVTGNPYLTASDLAVDGYDTTLAPATKPVLMQATGSTQSLHQLWRVTHLQNGYYTVRPYHYTPAGLYASGTSALTAYLGYYDIWEEVPSGFLWYIHGTTTPAGCNPNKEYFYAQPFGSGYRLENYADVTATEEAERAVTICDDYGGAEHRWIFSEVENPEAEVRYYDVSSGMFVSNPEIQLRTGNSEPLSSFLLISICSSGSISPEEYNWENSNPAAVTLHSYLSFCANAVGESTISINSSTYSFSGATLTVVIYLEGIHYNIPIVGMDNYTGLDAGAEVVRNSYPWVQIGQRIGNTTPLTCKEELQLHDLAVVSSHGGNCSCQATGIQLTAGKLYSHMNDCLESSDSHIQESDDFSSLEVVVFLACNTGYGGPGANNLPTVVVEQGARCAIGFSTKINVDLANIWLEAFYEYLVDGYTVYEAARSACDQRVSIPDDQANSILLSSLVFCGDQSYVLFS